MVYWSIKEYKLSERAFKKANRINEKFTAPLDNLAQMLISIGEFAKAQKKNLLIKDLDEPIAGMDPAARDYILNTIITNVNPDK